MAEQRRDGRHADQLRPIAIRRGYLNTVPGSVLFEMGQTRVVCTVSIEDRVPPFLVGTGRGWLTAEYGMLPGSSAKRIARESSTGRPNGRTQEIQRLIGRSLRSVMDLGTVGVRTFYVDCDVLQADGGTRTASITGGYVALAEAVARLLKDGVLERNPLREAVAAVSVGVVAGRVLLDLCYDEDSRAETDMNVVMTAGGGIVEVQGTAEGTPFSRSQAEAMMDLASRGIGELLDRQLADAAPPVDGAA
jgi:ribonuclease PH